MSIIKRIRISNKKTYLTRKEKRDAERQRKLPDDSPLLLILFITGIIGITFSASTMLQLSGFLPTIISIAAAASSTLLWFLFFKKPKLFLIFTGVMLFLIILVVSPEVYQLITIGTLSGSYFSGPVSIIVYGMLLYVLVYFVFSMEFVMRSHGLMFLIVTLMLLVSSVLGTKLSIIEILMLIVYQIAFMILNMSENGSRKRRLHSTSFKGVFTFACTAAAVTACLTFLPAWPVVETFSDDFVNQVLEFDTYIKDLSSKYLSGDPEAVAGGRINRGNLAQTGDVYLNVVLTKRPKTTIYLHGFHGGFYNNESNEWENVFEMVDTNYGTREYQEPFIQTISQDLHNKSGIDFSSSFMYTSDPVADIFYSHAMDNPKIEYNAVKMPEPVEIMIHHKSGNYNPLFIPYYSKNNLIALWMGDITRNGYHNSFITAEEINASGSLTGSTKELEDDFIMRNSDPYYVHKDDSTVKDKMYHGFLDEYKSEINERYTRYWSNEGTSRMETLVEENPLSSLEEITTFIAVTLQNHAEYSTTPGAVPFYKDTIDYFMFDNHKGYCVHFATAAALMYKMYGIPSRYVSGFVLNPQQLNMKHRSSMEDGEAWWEDNPAFFSSESDYFLADISDYSAHAWVEIFLDDYGWVPVEFTPTEKRTMVTSYPGFTQEDMKKIMEKKGWEFIGIKEDEPNPVGRGNFNFAAIIRDRTNVVVFFGTIIFAIVGVIVFFIVRRYLRIKKLPVTDCRVLFHYLMGAVHYAGILTDYNGSEKDFALHLHDAVPDITSDQSEKLMQIMYTVSFSENEITGEDRDFVEEIYRKASDYAFRKLKIYKKPLFIIKAYK